MEELKFKTKNLLKETLREIPLHRSFAIKRNDFKPSVVRNAATKLKAEGYLFEVSEEERVDDVVVKRLK